jgi:hypothetical protein
MSDHKIDCRKQVFDQQQQQRRHSYLLVTAMLILLTMTSACNFGKSTQTNTGISHSLFILRVKQGEIDRVGLSADRTQALAHTKDGKKILVNLEPDDTLVETLNRHVKGGIYVSPANVDK